MDNKEKIIWATKSNDYAKIKLLLDNGADVNFEDKYGNIALIEAAKRGNLKIVQLLISKGADVDIKNQYGNIALIEAAVNDYLDIVKLLLDNSANKNIINNEKFLERLKNKIRTHTTKETNKKEVQELYLEWKYQDSFIKNKKIDFDVKEIVKDNNSISVREGEIAFTDKYSNIYVLGTWRITNCVAMSFYNENNGSIALIHANVFSNFKKILPTIKNELIEKEEDKLIINIATKPGNYDHLFRRIKELQENYSNIVIKNIYYSTSLFINSKNGEILPDLTSDSESIQFLLPLESEENFIKFCIWNDNQRYERIEKREFVLCFNGKRISINKQKIPKIDLITEEELKREKTKKGKDFYDMLINYDMQLKAKNWYEKIKENHNNFSNFEIITKINNTSTDSIANPPKPQSLSKLCN